MSRGSRFHLPPRLANRTSRSAGIILGPGSSTLFIERVTEEDEGVYHCKATNQKGSAESWARLTVQGNCGRSCCPPPLPSPLFPCSLSLAFHLQVPCQPSPSGLRLPLASCPSPVPLGRACLVPRGGTGGDGLAALERGHPNSPWGWKRGKPAASMMTVTQTMAGGHS